jgi:hypothetical protein
LLRIRVLGLTIPISPVAARWRGDVVPPPSAGSTIGQDEEPEGAIRRGSGVIGDGNSLA